MSDLGLRRWGWSFSLILHATVLTAGGYLIVRPAQFGVAAAPSSTEVELVEDQPPAPVPPPPIPVVAPPVPSPEVPPVPRDDDVVVAKPLPLPKTLTSTVAPPAPVRHTAKRTEHPKSSASQGASSAQPDYLHNPPPVYPEQSREASEHGTVLLLVQVDRNGNPAHIRLKKTSGYGRLDQAALEAVRQWKFRPATLAGMPVASQVEVPVEFKLQ